MRPDQHKKKKNSEYKKKHGIPSDKGKKPDKKGPTTNHRSEEISRASDEPDLESDGTDVEDESSSHKGKRFSRRKIESNWERYKDDDFEFEDESNGSSSTQTAPIGADFQSLLDKATISSSHFQFENEKEWQNIDMNKTNGTATTSLLSIDCHALAQSLRNIPLAQRLDIDEKYSIGEVYGGANTNKSTLDKPLANHQIKVKKPTNINNSGKQEETVQSTMNFVSSKPSISTDEINSYEERSNVADLRSDNEIEQNNASNVESVVEDDLDLLLGLDKNEELNSLEEEIFVGAKCTRASGNQSEEEATVMTTQKPQSSADTKDDLEDWLDSILE